MTSLLTCRGVFNIRSGISTVFSLHRTIFRLIPPSYQSACRGRAGWLTPRRHHRVAYPLGKYKADTPGNERPCDVKVKEQKLNRLAVWPLTYFPRVTHLSSIPVVFHQPLPSPPHLTAHHICSYSIMCTLLCVACIRQHSHECFIRSHTVHGLHLR